MSTQSRRQLVLGLDVGGTGLKGAVLDQEGHVVARATRPVQQERRPAGVIEDMLGFAATLMQQGQQEQPHGEVVAACIAVPGLVDEEAGVARLSANLGWRDVPLRRLAQQRLNLSTVVVGHDVRTASIAEGLLGAARGSQNFLFITIGTGIGGAMVLDGQPYGGTHGVAGEIGHVTIDPDGPLCPCGRHGCLETLASASAVARRYQQMTQAPTALTAREVAERVQAGDTQAAHVWEEAVIALSIGLANYITLLDPERVVIGGGLAEAGDLLFQPLGNHLASEVRLLEVPPVVPAALGTAAGYLGAALRAWLALGVPKDALERWDAGK